MKRWIAFEHTEDGWPTDAYLVVAAETQDDAHVQMGRVIAARGTPGSRIWEIFIEAPRVLADDDPRSQLELGADGAVFVGFDEPARGSERPPGLVRPPRRGKRVWR